MMNERMVHEMYVACLFSEKGKKKIGSALKHKSGVLAVIEKAMRGNVLIDVFINTVAI